MYFKDEWLFVFQASNQKTDLEADVAPEVFAEMKAIAHASGKDSQKSKKAPSRPRLERISSPYYILSHQNTPN